MFCRQPIHVARADVAAWVHCINMYVQLHIHVDAIARTCICKLPIVVHRLFLQGVEGKSECRTG